VPPVHRAYASAVPRVTPSVPRLTCAASRKRTTVGGKTCSGTRRRIRRRYPPPYSAARAAWSRSAARSTGSRSGAHSWPSATAHTSYRSEPTCAARSVSTWATPWPSTCWSDSL